MGLGVSGKISILLLPKWSYFNTGWLGMPRKTVAMAIANMERPCNKHQVRQFLSGECSGFVPHIEEKASPFTDMINKKRPFMWIEVEENAFQAVKHVVCHAPRSSIPDLQ